MSDPKMDLVELQDALDEIAGAVDWAARWIESLEEEAGSWAALSDLPGFKVDAQRLRLIADALVPGRVRDPSVEGHRWYLAPDEAASRVARLSRELETAALASETAYAERQAERERRDKKK